jgi:SsrA-binding protein
MVAPTIEVKNRRAGFEYHILETFTCGMVLMGSEIKSIRAQGCNMNDAFCTFHDNMLVVRNMQIAPHGSNPHFVHEPKRDRALLLNRSELKRLRKAIKDQGITLVPLRLFINTKGLAKLDIALARGKKTYDKRESLKERDIARDMDREE